jgi:hypothetical protein
MLTDTRTWYIVPCYPDIHSKMVCLLLLLWCAKNSFSFHISLCTVAILSNFGLLLLLKQKIKHVTMRTYSSSYAVNKRDSAANWVQSGRQQSVLSTTLHSMAILSECVQKVVWRIILKLSYKYTWKWGTEDEIFIIFFIKKYDRNVFWSIFFQTLFFISKTHWSVIHGNSMHPQLSIATTSILYFCNSLVWK